MPVFFRFSSYVVFFWTHENDEPIHFHIAEGASVANSTKIWILSDGSFLLANNNSKIPERVLRRIFRVMADNVDDYIRQWSIVHGAVRFYR